MASWLTFGVVAIGAAVLAKLAGGGRPGVDDELEELEARLAPPPGGAPGPRGRVERETKRDGREELELSVRGLEVSDGTEVEVWLGERRVAGGTVASGRLRLGLDSGRGDDVPPVQAGDVVTLREGSRVLLEGVFRLD